MPARYNPHRLPSTEEPSSSSSTVVIHPDHDHEEFDQLLDEHHSLGSRCQAGDYLRQRIYVNGELLGLLSWGACCYALKDRDTYIGWNDRLRGERRDLGFPRKEKGKNFRKVPEYITYRNLLGQIDPDALAQHLSSWLQAQNGALPGTLALDGKMFKDIAGVVSLADAETGIPVSMAPMRHKEEGPDRELTCGKQALRTAGGLKGRTVTGDALHADTNTSRIIQEEGGEYLLQVKGNQPTLHKTVKRMTQNAPLFAPKSRLGTDESSSGNSES